MTEDVREQMEQDADRLAEALAAAYNASVDTLKAEAAYPGSDKVRVIIAGMALFLHMQASAMSPIVKATISELVQHIADAAKAGDK